MPSESLPNETSPNETSWPQRAWNAVRRVGRWFRRLGWLIGRLWGRVERAFEAVQRNALRFVGLLLVACVSLVGVSWGDAFLASGQIPEWRELVALGVALLAGATLLQVGPALAERLKKVGPVELYAEEVRQVLPELAHMLERVTRVDRGRPLVDVRDTPFEFTREERYFNRKADALVEYLEFSTVGSSALRGHRDVHKLISRVAGLALEQGENARAIDRLEWLLKVSDESYEPEETWTRLATARNLLADDLPAEPRFDGRRRELFEKAIEAGQRAIRCLKSSGKHDVRPFYQRGLGHHRLKEYSAAIKYYRLALEMESTHAPARYNLVASLAQRGRLGEAAEAMNGLRVDDLDIDRVLDQEYWHDEELKQLLAHEAHGPRFKTKIQALQSTRQDVP